MKSPTFWQALVGVLTAIAAITAVVVSLGTLASNSKQFAAQQQQQQQQQASDRFSQAVEQIGSDRQAIRIGGAHSLETLARQFPDQTYLASIDVLSAFVRDYAAPTPFVSPPSTTPKSAGRCPFELSQTQPFDGQIEEIPQVPQDIQAALSALGRRDSANDSPDSRLDLSISCLAMADMRSLNFADADFTMAMLSGAKLQGVDLRRSDLSWAWFTSAYVNGSGFYQTGEALLDGAKLNDATLTNAKLDRLIVSADFTDAIMIGATLTYADLKDSNLTNANLSNAVLNGANLRGTNLTGTILTSVQYDDQTSWPNGFTPPPSTN